ncbi:MAG: hypothetical protein M0P69_08280 [Bacteroidales bacterium]|jgi:hypothetical protein|nr:hypothetical protein [Bacteroidales bacterium]MDD3811666.1 hypothetical protein [Bacteroidales bacterium]MDD3871143.1 hypothetical protein [Bacteroidales bacterium]
MNELSDPVFELNRFSICQLSNQEMSNIRGGEGYGKSRTLLNRGQCCVPDSPKENPIVADLSGSILRLMIRIALM